MPEPRNTKVRIPSRWWLVLLVSIVIFMLVDTFDLLSFEELFQGLPEDQQIGRIQLVLAILFWPLVPLGLYVVYFGYRVVQSGQFPPPGSRRIKSVAVETGTLAMIRGWVAIATGLSLCALAVYGAVIIPGELAHLLSV